MWGGVLKKHVVPGRSSPFVSYDGWSIAKKDACIHLSEVH